MSNRRYHTAVALSSGGTAEIYKAWDSALGRDVALKFLRRDDPALVERMSREARAQARLDHPGICQVYEVGELDGRPFIAMEYVDGFELGVVAPEMHLEDKLQVVVQVAEAMHHAHQQGLVHRDLKPSNIMVEIRDDGTYRPVVVDFGLVYESIDDATAVTHAGQVLGTPPYLAPEQVEGRRDRLDRRTDVYGLGATFYELLTGRPPFVGERTVDLLIQTLRDDPVPPRRLVPSLPTELDTIALHCLEKDPGRRYASARALARDLGRFRDGEPIDARPPSLVFRLGRTIRRYRLVVAVAVVLGVVGLSALAVTHRRAEQRLRYEQRFSQLGRDLDWSLRAIHMSARHDISPGVADVREQLSRIEAELPTLGALGRPPARHALGRVYVTLGEDDVARDHLEAAWQAGYRTPDVAYALGLVLGRDYERALNRARRILDPAERRRMLDEVHATRREPVLRYLDLGRGGDIVSPAFVEALMALYEQRFDDALSRLDEARSELPWLFETSVVAGRVLTQLGDAAVLERGDTAEAHALLTRALDAFGAATESAPSSPAARIGSCHAGARRLRLALQRPSPSVVAERDRVYADCEVAIEVDPASAEARVRHAEALLHWARHLVWTGSDPDPTFAAALASAERAVELDPDEAAAHAELGEVLVLRAEHHVASRSQDPRPDLDAAAKALERSLALVPEDSHRLNVLGGIWRIRGTWEARNGYDATASVERAVDYLDAAIAASPNLFDRHHNRGNALVLRCYLLFERGDEYGDCLAEMEASYRRGAELNPDLAWGHMAIGTSLSMQASRALLLGDDPEPLLDEAFEQAARAIEINPAVGEFYFWRTSFHVQRAVFAWHAEDDPSPHLDAAREELAAAAALDRGRPDEAARALEIEALALRAAMRSGAPLEPALRRGDRQLVAIDEHDDRGQYYFSAIGDFHLWAAAALQARGRDADPRIEQGLAIVDAAIGRDLEVNEHLGRRGALRWLAAQSATTAADRERLLLAAEDDLDAALGANRWLALDLDPWIERVRRDLDRGPRVDEARH